MDILVDSLNLNIYGRTINIIRGKERGMERGWEGKREGRREEGRERGREWAVGGDHSVLSLNRNLNHCFSNCIISFHFFAPFLSLSLSLSLSIYHCHPLSISMSLSISLHAHLSHPIPAPIYLTHANIIKILLFSPEIAPIAAPEPRPTLRAAKSPIRPPISVSKPPLTPIKPTERPAI